MRTIPQRAVSRTIGGVGVYLVHIRVCCNSGDSSKFAVVLEVSGRVLAAIRMRHGLSQRGYYVTLLLT